MKISGYFLKSIFSVLIFSFLAVLILGWQFAPPAESAEQNVPGKEKLENYDIRTDKSETARRTIEKYVAEAGKNDLQVSDARKISLEAVERLRVGSRNLKIEFNEDLRVPEVISPALGIKADFLTLPSKRKRTEVLENFLKQNSELFGVTAAQISALETTADYTNPNGVLSFVHFGQKIRNIPVFRGEVKAGFTKRGEMIRVINNLVPNLDYENLSADFGSAADAVLSAAKHIGAAADELDVRTVNSESNDLKITFERGRFSDKTTAEKIYFPIEYGVARPAWRVLLWTNTDAFYVIVDAQNGTLLWRKNITEYQNSAATFNVYGNTTSLLKTADSPTPLTPSCASPLDCPQPPLITRQNFTLVGNEPPYTFNNLGWIPDNGLSGTPNQSGNITDGNAVEAGVDRVSPNGVDAPVSGSPNRVFSFNYNPPPGNPPPGDDPLMPEFQKGSVTNAFYVVNRWHDEMYLLGFTEQAGNFQHFNFGRGGSEGDRISAEIQDSSGFNNANFAAPADGARPRMQMYLWNNTTPNRDGSLDAHVLVHETTHGLSTRLHGNSTGLGTPMAAGLGEGWSDLYPLAFLSEPSDNIFSLHAVGGYASSGLSAGNSYYYGARRFPYGLRAVVGQNGFSHNPLTLGNLNLGNCATFNSAFAPRFTSTNCGAPAFIGEVWATALWEIRGQLVLRHGWAEGTRRALQIITDAMKISPLNPTILQSRDAVLVAAQVNTVSPETNSDVIDVWRGFAIRGLGVNAQLIGTTPVNVVESFDVPPTLNIASRRADFDGDGRADLSIFRPSEGNWYVNRSAAGFAVVNWGLSTDRLAPGDYDSDGKTDFAVFRANDGNEPDFYILNSSTFTLSGYQWGITGDIPIVEDYDGDGKSDPAVFRQSDSRYYALKSGGGILAFQIGNGNPSFNATPVAGDFDGDNKADLVYTYNTGNLGWNIRKSSNNYILEQIFFGIIGDHVVVADYDGNGTDEVAVYRPSNGTWYIRQSASVLTSIQFGNSTDIPSPADYDGDGKDDIAIYRFGTWWIMQSTAGLLVTQFGVGGDMPIANRYLP